MNTGELYFRISEYSNPLPYLSHKAYEIIDGKAVPAITLAYGSKHVDDNTQARLCEALWEELYPILESLFRPQIIWRKPPEYTTGRNIIDINGDWKDPNNFTEMRGKVYMRLAILDDKEAVDLSKLLSMKDEREDVKVI